MSKIIAVAKSGKNALTSTDPNDFIFHSSFNTFKIIDEGTLLSQSVTTDPTTFTLAHNQSQIPTFYAFAKFPDGKVAMPNSFDYTVQDVVATGYGVFSVEADSTNLYFMFSKLGSNYSVDIKYYIFESPL